MSGPTTGAPGTGRIAAFSAVRCRLGLRVLALLLSVTCTGAAAETPAVARQRFTVVADGHPLAVWARVPAAPRAAIVLVHGRTWSSRPDFDLQVPGLPRSVLQSLADRGVAAYAVDLRGYGETPRDASGYLTPDRAAADVEAVLRWVARRHPALPTPALLGWSNGAFVAYYVAHRSAALLSSLTLFGYTPEIDVTFGPGTLPAPPVAPAVKNTREAAASDFIAPAVTPPAVVAAFVTQALAADPIYAEWTADRFVTLTAAALRTPVLVLHGEHDPGADAETAEAFLAGVAAGRTRHVVLPGADHCAHLEDTHDLFVSAVTDFVIAAARR